MLRRLLTLLALPLVACVEQPAPDTADTEGLEKSILLQMAQLNVIGGAENCGNGIDDDRDGKVDFNDPDCGSSLFEDLMDGTNIHPGDRGTLNLWDGPVKYTYTGSTSTTGGSLRLERSVLTPSFTTTTYVTTVRLAKGNITRIEPGLTGSRLTPTGTALAIGTDKGAGWLVDDGFTNNEIYED